ncbi:DUF393 domain-containing protein [Achromobacter xylosoxidans]|nr:DCC1-like thiol-disulfide oxidoreductase family protein [Achromobacter xylosoxidans]MCM2573568.1 DUF393 domain-containing protein [Achromobacter xylosoxidans]
MSAQRNFLLYDGDCPFCSNYVRFVRLREAVGPVDLLNMRDEPDLVRHYTGKGIDLNNGMLLHLNNVDYWGADCINRLALLSSGSGWLNRLNAAIFRSRTASAFLYPIMRAGRNLTLRLLGRRPVEL